MSPWFILIFIFILQAPVAAASLTNLDKDLDSSISTPATLGAIYYYYILYENLGMFAFVVAFIVQVLSYIFRKHIMLLIKKDKRTVYATLVMTVCHALLWLCYPWVWVDPYLPIILIGLFFCAWIPFDWKMSITMVIGYIMTWFLERFL